ncbi:hypothetical protein IGI04_038650 [Brassica rapa subsp. trilocularis]|uniref:Uncharacterized protein n=1 Tax=Brassica rapa subsp. trilocularis TaxID=1813537 RepID=A0ABQ7LKV3_BRACM|nr:hypothetical protein IGI04_038650 [Brassica rapa subsp. trilocularis]
MLASYVIFTNVKAGRCSNSNTAKGNRENVEIYIADYIYPAFDLRVRELSSHLHFLRYSAPISKRKKKNKKNKMKRVKGRRGNTSLIGKESNLKIVKGFL